MKYNILDFGAIADGKALCTDAIQKAIDKCAASGGGRVTFPQGKFKSGTLWLKSGVELHFEMGAELLASDNMSDYNDIDAYEQNFGSTVEGWVGKHLIIALEAENVAISGLGTINGNCHAFVNECYDYPEYQKRYAWGDGISALKDEDAKRTGQLICFIECRRVCVTDVTIKNSPCWSCFFLGCEFVGVRGIKVFNPLWMMNSDGIDIDASRYVTVSDCIIETGDDAVAIRACEQRVKNKTMHSEYITVSNCVFSTQICAFRIGVGTGIIRHVRVSNITVSRCENLVQFCTAYLQNGCANIEDVNFSNISADNTSRVVEAFANNGAYIRNVTMENIRSTSHMTNYIDAIDGTIENFILRNAEIYFYDKYENLSPELIMQRGVNLLRVKNATRVALDNVFIHGGLYKNEETFVNSDCKELIIKNCNF